MKTKRLCLIPLFLAASGLWAVDFGLMLDQNANFSAFFEEKGAFAYSASLLPRLSGLIGETGDFYISARAEADYSDTKWSVIPELLRTQISFYPGGGLGFSAGRMHHSDPLGLIAEGLFDGVEISYESPAGTFSAGGWYTGFLYKKRAEIAMTPKEAEALNTGVDYKNFTDSYFAPARVIANLDWEHLGLAGPLQVRFALLAQFDLADDPLNSQYAALKLTLPVGAFAFNLGGCLELIQPSGKFDFSPESIASAAELGAAWTFPTALRQRLSFVGRYSSGAKDGGMAAFLPVTTEVQGNLLKPKLSGISMFQLDYLARLHYTLSLGLTSSYFMRTDLNTYAAYPVLLTSDGGVSADSEGYLLGNEFFARLLWSPVSDIQVNLGGGVFLPSLGNVAPDAAGYWRAELNVVISLF